MLVKIEARILIFPGTDFHFPRTRSVPGTFLGSGIRPPHTWFHMGIPHNPKHTDILISPLCTLTVGKVIITDICTYQRNMRQTHVRL